MSAQTAPQFAFLSQPPPPLHKKRPTPLPSPPGYPLPPIPVQATPVTRRRSSTFSSIAAWAAHVQPGSPAPRSPHRRLSTTSARRPSLTRLARRPSITHARAPSGSFAHIIDIDALDTPSAASNFELDLTAHGYTSLFVRLPKTPTTPSPLLRAYNAQHAKPAAAPAKAPLSASFAIANIPIPPVPQEPKRAPAHSKGGMKRFRSLTILRPKAKQAPAPAQPTTPAATSSQRAASIAQRKRSKYAHVRPPPPLANELALMQFADGGSLDANIKRVMEAQAKATAGHSAAPGGVGDVYRDAQGGVWWDADEEMEYAHLLEGDGDVGMDMDMVDMHWEEDFDMVDASEPVAAHIAAPATNPAANSTADKENLPVSLSRRTSLTSEDSDLDPKYLLPLPENEDPRLAPPDDRVLVSTTSKTNAKMSVLSLPARPRRRAAHLCKTGFLVDGVAWELPGPVPSSPRSPRSPTRSVGGMGVGQARPKGKARRRPAPLKLASSNITSSPVSRRPATPAAAAKPTVPSPQRLRNEFIADSFEPVPALPASLPVQHTSTTAVPASPVVSTISKATRHAKVRGFFGMGRKVGE
ncbi:hypothetical protein JR316_0007957 [Psilocybe cubensis]|uniref:Uncharacterized protein n=2 Tax=Psilocybe cubensis TaxID=181762 RepID=A0A8H7XVQ6_PSICU|nr:hypothetical protein JR316_0007957 [Psilocybe cubensis]KAH9479367.1 hypothetical protein JR316_0007957 [Psilocybe cubensis]